MAKIRTYWIEYPDPIFFLEVIHHYYQCSYQPDAYHSIYAYTEEQMPPWVDAYQAYPTLELGLLAARSWASRPAMINDICLACRYHHYGAHLPRWNIYRGEDHPKFIPEFHEYPARFVPCFFMPYWDPPPPGYGKWM